MSKMNITDKQFTLFLVSVVAIVGIVGIVSLIDVSSISSADDNIAGEAFSRERSYDSAEINSNELTIKGCCIIDGQSHPSYSQEECKRYGGSWEKTCGDEESETCCYDSVTGEFHMFYSANPQQECKDKYGGYVLPLEKCDVEERCCYSSQTGEFYMVSDPNPSQFCKDEHQGYLVADEKCEEQSDCCVIEDDSAVGFHTEILPPEKCKDQEGTYFLVDDEKLCRDVCCRVNDAGNLMWTTAFWCENNYQSQGIALDVSKEECLDSADQQNSREACCLLNNQSVWLPVLDCQDDGGAVLYNITDPDLCDAYSPADHSLEGENESLGCCYDFNPIFVDNGTQLSFVNGQDDAFQSTEGECDDLGVGAFFHQGVPAQDCYVDLAQYCCCKYSADGSTHSSLFVGHPDYCTGGESTSAEVFYYPVNASNGIHCEADVCEPYRESLGLN
ncbi:MAG: hypothetical protein ACQESC_01095 [Nanobdellota archaeon]